MAKSRGRNERLTPEDSEQRSPLQFIDDFLHKLTAKNTNETKANLSILEWLVYIGLLVFTLVMPFLYSRLTTENFLTPKEFFTKMLVGVLCGLLFAKVFFNKKPQIARTKLDIPIILFLAFMFVSIFYSGNIASGFRDYREVICVMLLFPIVVNVVRARWQLELLLWTVMFTGLATSLIGIMETYNWYFVLDPVYVIRYVKDEVLAGVIDPNKFYIPLFPQLASKDYAMTSVVSTFGNRNYLGTFAMFTAFVPLSFFFYYKGKVMKMISLSLFALLLSGLYVSRCRAALIGIGIGVGYMILMMLLNDRNKKLIKRNALFFSVAVSIIFVALLLVSVKTLQNLDTENMFDKIKKTFTLDRSVSNTYERMWVWHGNNEAFSKSIVTWIFGRGFASFKHFFPLQEAETLSERNKETFTPVTFRQAHNDWIQVLSEMGLVGLVLLLFILYRFFGIIQASLRKEIFEKEDGEMTGDQMLLIGLTAAMVSQLLAALPDFPFHRIETAAFAILFLGLIPVLTDTDFFKKHTEKTQINIEQGSAAFMGALFLFSALMNLYFEFRSWKADCNARAAEMFMKSQSREALAKAKMLLLQGIDLDPLPGDPYLKLAGIYQQENDHKTALYYADKAWDNINFNARSTYHSVTFRKLHIYYHLLNNLPEARKYANEGLHLTAGDARSIYYMYAGKIAVDMLPTADDPELKKELLEESQNYLVKAAKYDNFSLQANAALAISYATAEKWHEARETARLVSQNVNDRDPFMLNIIGVAATHLNDFDEAVKTLEKAVSLNPNVLYVRDLGTAYYKNGQLEFALQKFKSIVDAKGVDASLKKYAEQMIAEINK